MSTRTTESVWNQKRERGLIARLPCGRSHQPPLPGVESSFGDGIEMLLGYVLRATIVFAIAASECVLTIRLVATDQVAVLKPQGKPNRRV